ncbi:MAG: hypothetical protein Q7S46_06040 [Gallionella sp.]|nr:hypothetical protein [Gallionella sp.]
MELAQSALQYASWPIVALVSLFLFKEHIGKALRNVRFFKAGSLELGFNEQIQNQGFTDTQLKIIHNLSAQEIDLFLLVSFSDGTDFNYNTGIDQVVFREALLKLQEAGLIVVTNPNDLPTNLRHITSPIGRRVRAMLINSTVTLLHADN